ncbi:hypothetical protein [Luteimonas aquatica]|uniref:hypothetical protein n=1 Tax=Luteimonas aquatica TaxID=450364 RepID=UPI001F59DA4A|nr:hypothetical protein [Luteimonas aquatica]
MTNISVCGYEFDKNDFHRILKPRVLAYLREQEIDYSKIGDNPDITCKKGIVILTGQHGGGKVDTGIRFRQILADLGYLTD